MLKKVKTKLKDEIVKLKMQLAWANKEKEKIRKCLKSAKKKQKLSVRTTSHWGQRT